MDDPQLHKLIRAIKAADLGAIERLCQSGVEPNQETQYGQTPLTIAAINGNTRVIQTLIDAGANVNLASALGMTPLTWAVWAGKKNAEALLRSVGAAHETSNVITEFDREHYPELEIDYPFWRKP